MFGQNNNLFGMSPVADSDDRQQQPVNYQTLVDSPAYQQADLNQRMLMSGSFFDEYVRPRLDLNIDFDNERERFLKMAGFEGDTDAGVLSSFFNAASGSAFQSAGDTLNDATRIVNGTTNFAGDALRELGEEDYQQMNPRSLQRMRDFSWSNPETMTWEGAAMRAGGVLGSLLPFFVGGGLAGVGVKGAAAVAGRMGAKTVGKHLAKRAAHYGYGMVGGGMLGGAISQQVYDEIMAIPDDVLREQPAFQQAKQYYMDVYGDTDRALQEARAMVATQGAKEAAQLGTAVGGVTSGLLGHKLEQLILGKTGKGVGAAALQGFGVESGQELSENLSQELITQSHVGDFNPEREKDFKNNMIDATLDSFVFGGGVGAGTSGAAAAFNGRGKVDPQQEGFSGKALSDRRVAVQYRDPQAIQDDIRLVRQQIDMLQATIGNDLAKQEEYSHTLWKLEQQHTQFEMELAQSQSAQPEPFAPWAQKRNPQVIDPVNLHNAGGQAIPTGVEHRPEVMSDEDYEEEIAPQWRQQVAQKPKVPLDNRVDTQTVLGDYTDAVRNIRTRVRSLSKQLSSNPKAVTLLKDIDRNNTQSARARRQIAERGVRQSEANVGERGQLVTAQPQVQQILDGVRGNRALTQTEILSELRKAKALSDQELQALLGDASNASGNAFNTPEALRDTDLGNPVMRQLLDEFSRTPAGKADRDIIRAGLQGTLKGLKPTRRLKEIMRSLRDSAEINTDVDRQLGQTNDKRRGSTSLSQRANQALTNPTLRQRLQALSRPASTSAGLGNLGQRAGGANLSPPAARSAIQRALAGKPLGKKQAAYVEALTDTLRDDTRDRLTNRQQEKRVSERKAKTEQEQEAKEKKSKATRERKKVAAKQDQQEKKSKLKTLLRGDKNLAIGKKSKSLERQEATSEKTQETVTKDQAQSKLRKTLQAGTQSGSGGRGGSEVSSGAFARGDNEALVTVARGVKGALYTLSDDLAKTMTDAEVNPEDMVELVNDANGRNFYLDSLKAAMRGNKYVAALTPVYKSDLVGARLFTTKSGTAGVVVKGNTFGSVFSDGSNPGIGAVMVGLAIHEGARRGMGGAFDTVTPFLYAKLGLRVAARIKFDERYKPDGWDYEVFKPFNNGRPDVVFFAFDPDHDGTYKEGEGKLVKDFDAAMTELDKFVNKKRKGDAYYKFYGDDAKGVVDRYLFSQMMRYFDKSAEALVVPERSRQIADDFALLADPTLDGYEETDAERAVFESFKAHAPDFVEAHGIKDYADLVKKAYRQMVIEVERQFDALPIEVSFHSGDKDYASSDAMRQDVQENNHLWVFTGGEAHTSADQLFTKVIGGKEMQVTANEMFRAVHDYFGHNIYPNQFGAKGEENAWDDHMRTFSRLAALAVASETRGQNSWVNFSGVNDKALAKIRESRKLKGQERTKALAEANAKFQYAEQKSVVLPYEHVNEIFEREVKRPSRYSLNKADSTGVDANELAQEVMHLARKLGTKVNVMADETELPPDLYRQILDDNAMGRVEGVFHDGNIYLVASNLDSVEDGRRTVLHEAVGHKGFRQLMGNNLNLTLGQIYTSLDPQTRHALSEKYKDQIRGKSEAEARRIIAEEYVANLAETDPQNTLLDKVVAKIREWLRKLFPTLKYSRNDIVSLLAQSQAALRNGTPVDTTGAVRYSDSEFVKHVTYSKLGREIYSLPDKSFKGKSLLNQLKKADGVNLKEITWIGLDEFLSERESVTRVEVVDYFAENQIILDPVYYGDLPESDSVGEDGREARLDKLTEEVAQSYHNDYIPTWAWEQMIVDEKEEAADRERKYWSEEEEENLLVYRESSGISEDKTDQEILNDKDFQYWREEMASDYVAQVYEESPEDFFGSINLEVRENAAREWMEENPSAWTHSTTHTNVPHSNSYSLPHIDAGTYGAIVIRMPDRSMSLAHVSKLFSDKDKTRLMTGKPVANVTVTEPVEGADYHVINYFGENFYGRTLEDAIRETEERHHFRSHVPAVSYHWPESNVVGWVRFQVFEDRHGNNVLHIEEIQSDWHQALDKSERHTKHRIKKKELGKGVPYAKGHHYHIRLQKTKDALKQRLRVARFHLAQEGKKSDEYALPFIEHSVTYLNRLLGDLRSIGQERLADDITFKYGEMQSLGNATSNLPDSPFRKNWNTLVLKYLVAEAVHKKYDRITLSAINPQMKRRHQEYVDHAYVSGGYGENQTLYVEAGDVSFSVHIDDDLDKNPPAGLLELPEHAVTDIKDILKDARGERDDALENFLDTLTLVKAEDSEFHENIGLLKGGDHFKLMGENGVVHGLLVRKPHGIESLALSKDDFYRIRKPFPHWQMSDATEHAVGSKNLIEKLGGMDEAAREFGRWLHEAEPDVSEFEIKSEQVYVGEHIGELVKGTKQQYEVVLPATMEKFVEKFGGTTGRTSIEDGDREDHDVFYMTISDEVKELVRKEGFSMYRLKDNRYSIKEKYDDKELEDHLSRVLHAGGREAYSDRIGTHLKSFFTSLVTNPSETLAGALDTFRDNFIDDLAYWEVVEKNRHGKLRDANVSAVKIARASRNSHDVVHAAFLHGAPMMVNGSIVINKDTKGLMDVLDPVAKAGNVRLWEAWMSANRAKRILAEDRAAKQQGINRKREKLHTDADINMLNRKVQEMGLLPMFESVKKEWQVYNRAMLDFGEQTGLIDPEARAIWEREDYIPFHRVFPVRRGDNVEELQKLAERFQAKKGLKVDDPIDVLDGSERGLTPLEGMLLQTEAIIKQGLRNESMRRLMPDASKMGITRKRNIKIKMEDAIVEQAMKERGIDGFLDDANAKAWGKLLAVAQKLDTNFVHYMENGKPVVYEVFDHRLLKSVKSLLSPDELSKVVEFFGGASDLLRFGVTNSPDFILRNYIRDTLTTFIAGAPLNKDGKHVPVSLMTSAMSLFRKDLKNDPALKQMMISGAGVNPFIGVTTDNVRRQVTGGRSEVGKAYDTWREFAGRSEVANRMAIYESAISGGASPQEAAYQAGDLLPFSRRGASTIVRNIARLVPFLNAQVQGIDKLHRSVMGKDGLTGLNGRFMIGAFTYSAASLALMALFEDDERYKELTKHDRINAHHAWLDNIHITIPRPFESGAFFATIPELLIQYMRDKEGGEFVASAISQTLRKQLLLDPTPQVAKPFVELLLNENFMGRSIVQKGQEFADPTRQRSPYTKQIFKDVAEAMPENAYKFLRSPAQLEHLFRSYLGTVPMMAVEYSDQMMRQLSGAPLAPAKDKLDVPALRAVIKDDNRKRGNRSREEFFELLQQAREAYAAVEEARKEGNKERLAKLGKDKQTLSLLKKRAGLNKVANLLRTVRKERNAMLDGLKYRKLTPEQKREKLNEFEQRMNDITKRAMRYLK